MGNELSCKIRLGGKTSQGKALLETSAIVIQGDVRLKIALSTLSSVEARAGELHLKWGDGAAVLELGARAESWAHKILHPKGTVEKLGVKPGLAISAIAVADEKFVSDLRAAAKSFSDTRALKNSDLLFFGAEKVAALVRVTKLLESLSVAGALWIVYPKGRQEIKEQDVLDAGRGAGLVDVKVVSFSSTHTALKFVRPKARR